MNATVTQLPVTRAENSLRRSQMWHDRRKATAATPLSSVQAACQRMQAVVKRADPAEQPILVARVTAILHGLCDEADYKAAQAAARQFPTRRELRIRKSQAFHGQRNEKAATPMAAVQAACQRMQAVVKNIGAADQALIATKVAAFMNSLCDEADYKAAQAATIGRKRVRSA